MVVLGIGVAIGILVGGDGGSGSAAASATTRQGSGPGIYSMNGITNTCDVVDPTPLTKWSSTPKGAPNHRETRPSTHDSGSLKCDVGYTSSTGDEFSMNRARMSVEAEFTDGTAPPFYDHWKHADTATAGPGSVSGDVTGIGNQGAAPAYDRWKQTDTAATGAGLASGEVTGIGAQGYWHTATTDTSNGMTYILGVHDSNISVRVEVAVLRAKGEPPVNRDELDTIAKNQAQQALNGLKKE
ncbi:hypothetical protein OH799_05550 [Nocardia sp. NBC_00881]|uniref:hypothetical protein n=1 Tax=Nocardia sp. NBC_00881 TaxID=2975995 RepID=UPI00386DFE32|nr:hypothetical protein OH799_05550 [Nocardia sp. NBC_00881]